ncbi:ROK family protein [Synechocystis sp. LKSZ1]|uniref:ROK family protein n=1 Tax=Synechocystis sp. LKSZ1 TaxID=3144951 RepID=UPI00336BB324
MNQAQVMGIDLGGTAIKLGRFLADGTCLASFSVPTPQPAFPEAVLQALIPAIQRLKTEHCQALGVGMPGPTDASRRLAKLAINLPQWHNVPLADWLETAIGLPVVLENDANCAGLGEAWLGAGRHFQDFILLTLGTGVGGAIFLGGNLFVGRHGAAGELGLLSIDYRGPDCHSGNRGSLEQHVSAQAIQRETGKNGAELAQLAAKGIPEALAYWERYGQLLGVGLANLLYVLTPQAVILGGGISASADYFLPALTAEIQDRVLAPTREDLTIVVAELGNRAGMLGAARLAWQSIGKG